MSFGAYRYGLFSATTLYITKTNLKLNTGFKYFSFHSADCEISVVNGDAQMNGGISFPPTPAESPEVNGQVTPDYSSMNGGHMSNNISENSEIYRHNSTEKGDLIRHTNSLYS